MATPLRPATDLLKLYAEYHRDRRNIVTHFVGVPRSSTSTSNTVVPSAPSS